MLASYAAGTLRPVDGYKAYYEYILDRPVATAGGAIVLNFTIDEKGRPYDFMVIESPSPEAVEIVIRIIDSGPTWSHAEEVQTFAVML